MTSEKISKFKIILIDFRYDKPSEKQMQVVQGTWKQIQKQANAWCREHDYATWKIVASRAKKNVIDLSKIKEEDDD